MMTRHNPMMPAGGTAVLDAPATIAPVGPVPSPSAPSRGLKKVSFGAIAKPKDTKTVYPVFPDDDRKASEIAARILERTEKFEALKGALETDKAELKFMVAPHYFKANHGRNEVPSSVAVHVTGDDGRMLNEVLVTFQNRYPQLADEAGLLPILGDEQTGLFFRQAFEMKIKGDNIPQDHAQEIINEIQALFARFNCADALEVKEGIKPASDFHEKRHLQLTPEQNLAIEEVCPVTAMIKTKGRK